MTIPRPNTAKLNHPMADKISIIDHKHAYARQGSTSEIAFFMGKDWVTDIIEPFEAYADVPAGDTLVYAYVPNEILDDFLKTYRA
jgi:hypothetical protein